MPYPVEPFTAYPSAAPMLRHAVTPLLGLVPSLTAAPLAQEWPQFRGPGGRGVAESGTIPRAFGPGENVVWSTDVPAGHSSPCIVGRRIFLTGFEDGESMVLAIDRKSGKILWKKGFKGEALRSYAHPDATPALPTPVADAERVIVCFATYGLIALDFDGNVLWEKRLPDPGHAFGQGSSPLLTDGRLVLVRDGAPEAAILCLDASDGSLLWRIDRFEFRESHGTPFLWRNADRDELVVGGSNKLVSYDPESGERLWFVEGLTSFPCTTPTGDEDRLYFAAWSTPNATGRSLLEATFARSFELSDEEIENPKILFERLDVNSDGKVHPDELPECRAKDAFHFLDGDRSGYWTFEELVGFSQYNAPGRNLMVAVKRGAEGDASKSHVAWSYTRGLPYVASPLLHDGRIWLVKSGGLVTCLDAKSGEPVFSRERLEDRSEYYLSPIAAGGRVIVGSAEGTLYLLDAEADEMKVVHTAHFDDELFATPAALGGTLYLRSKTKLWAFGEGAN